ncbi:MAG: tRNA pseudouridine(38-40) synthase TruA [Rudaea sp.]|uniref:tRNA pseudouridine(38-40) synthase TruA n=1 Tax=Rudaea sp. TaxID=2136325 RepID=UPI0039E3A9FC
MRIALGIEYDGTDFHGWQRLGHGPSVQAAVEAALSKVADEPVEVTCAGRTDAGVHARCQVVHFDTAAERSARGWMLGANSNLPRGVAVVWARPVADDFHARFSALARRYRYTILNRTARAALDARQVAWERLPLDAGTMHAAAQALLGENDFSAFRTVACQARTPMRNVHEIAVWREGERVIVEIQANAFLHHMVRNIVGSLLPVGRGEEKPEWIARLLGGRDRGKAGPTAVAQGLVFLHPLYPREHGLPDPVSLAS